MIGINQQNCLTLKSACRRYQFLCFRKHTLRKENQSVFPKLILFKRMASVTDQITLQKKEEPLCGQSEKERSKLRKNTTFSVKKMNHTRHLHIHKNKVHAKEQNGKTVLESLRKYRSVCLGNSSPIQAFSFDTYQGTRAYNEDRISFHIDMKIKDSLYAFFAVFDGHGGAGVADYLKMKLPRKFEQFMNDAIHDDVLQILKIILYDAEEQLLNRLQKKIFGGSCASILVIQNENYYVANVGDSRIVKSSFVKGKMMIDQITTDHKPENSIQRERIEAEGGRIYRNASITKQTVGPYRIYPCKLSVSRTIGDASIKKEHCGIISSQPQLRKGTVKDNQLFLIMSDGAYEKFSNQQIVSYFSKDIKNGEASSKTFQKSMHSFIFSCMKRQSTDNVTLLSILTKKN